MSSSFKLKSHPNKLLIDHLRNVGRLSKGIISSKHIEHKNVLSDLAYLIGISHDFGKATTFFQNKLESDKKTKYARHSYMSSLLGYHLTRNYLCSIHRLEEFWHIPAIAWIAIKRHHGNIHNLRGFLDAEASTLNDPNKKEIIEKQIQDILTNNISEVKKIYKKILGDFEVQKFIDRIEGLDKFTREIRKSLVKICRGKNIEHYFFIMFFYSVLLDADKLDASETIIPARIKGIKRAIINKYKRVKFSLSGNPINEVREKAYEQVNNVLRSLDLQKERVLSINLPTGMGKTLTGLSFSLGLREQIAKELGFTPRIIYSLPFLSIIDQNGKVIEDVLMKGGGYDEIPSNLFLKHHHLADIEYIEVRDGELYPVKDLNKCLLLMEGWNSEIVITTFVQFFHSLITNRNRAARKFHNIVNSIIILDEVQSIPHKYWLLVNKTLKYLAAKFNCWIILMTATKPLIFETNREIKDLIKDREQYFGFFDRIDFNFDLDGNGDFHERSFDLFADEIFAEVVNNRDKDLMVILNTIESSKKLYKHLKNKLSICYNLSEEQTLDGDGVCNFPDLDLINLSTNILPFFRLSRIYRIKKKNKRKVVITTQLIEAGVDISVDIIYRDMAPLDCIIQSAGRCNRNNEKKGMVNVVLLKDENGRNFCDYIYDRVLIDATKEVIQDFGKKASEREFVIKATDKYYRLVKERGSPDKSEAILDHLRKLNFSNITEFRLIEEKLPSTTIFVEIDENAENTRKEIQEILEQKEVYGKRKSLLRIRKAINQYTLSIRHSRKSESIIHLPCLGGEDFKYIPREDLENWYDLDTGFCAPENDVSMRII